MAGGGNKSLYRSLDKSKCLAKNDGKYREAYDLCLYKGETMRQNGDHEEALAEFEEAFGLCELLAEPSPLDRAEVHRRSGECLMHLERFAEATDHLRRYLSLAESAGSHLEQQRALATLGQCYFVQHQSGRTANDRLARKARSAFLRSLRIVEDHLVHSLDSSEVALMKGRLFLNMGLLCDATEDDSRAVHNFQLALTLFASHRAHFREDLARCLSALAGIHLRQGHAESALSLAGRLLDLGREDRRAEVKCEAHLCRGAALLQAGDLDEARAAFKRAARQNSPVPEDRERAVLCVKLAQALRTWQLDLRDTQDVATRVGIHEKAGDALAYCLLHRQALAEYAKAIKEALSSPGAISDKKLAELYVSMAETCRDVREYDSALKYFRLELATRKNEPEETASTNLGIARLLRKMGESAAEVRDALQEAIKQSCTAGKTSLEVECLEELLSLQGGSDEQIEARLKELRSAGVDSQDDLSQSQHSVGILSDIDLADISDASESDPEFCDSVRKPRKRLEGKINTKGETRLHKACIEGSLKKVTELLRMHHAVNVSDFSGWQPIHEAANFGHLEIVKCLVSHGADVNSPGLNGVTPLHDALENGHLEVALYLLEKGASPGSKTDQGQTPLDSLVEWKERIESPLNSSEEALLEKIELLLKNGKHSTRVVANRPRPTAKVNPWIASQSSSRKTQNEPALVDEEVAAWLIDDLAKPKSKSRRVAEPKFPATRKRHHSSSSSDSSLSAKTLRADPNEEGDAWGSNNAEVPMDYLQPRMSSPVRSLTSPPASPLASPPASPLATPSSSVSLTATSICSLRVRILGTVFLIPVPRGTSDSAMTVGWLAAEAAKRYLNVRGTCPILSMTLPDGALLDPFDSLDNLFHSPQTEIIGHVESWDLPPLAERYRAECERRNLPSCANFATAFQPCVDSGTLSIPCFSGVNLEVFFRALRHQESLHTLDISGTKMTPAVVTVMCGCLTTLQSLRHLALRCTNFGPACLDAMVQSLHKSQVQLPCLELDLSYNPIGSGTALASLLGHTPSLKVLKLESCNVPDPGSVLRGLKTLEALHIGFNPLGCEALEMLGPILEENPLRILDLVGCFAQGASGLGESLARLISKCRLVEVRVGSCGLTERDASALGVLCGGALSTLDLTLSPGLGPDCLEDLSRKLQGVRILSDYSSCASL